MKMENRNQYNSPRDRIDDALLIRLLNEEETLPEYNCTGERRDRSRTNCGCSGNGGSRSGGNSREWGENRKSCGRKNDGCGDNRENRDNGRCGSNRENRDNGRCGENRENRDNCGCGSNRDERNNCGCGNTRERQCNPMERQETSGYCESCSAGGCLTGYALAMAYTPDHDFDGLFDEEEALSHGTLFRPLEFPFYPGCGGNCRCR